MKVKNKRLFEIEHGIQLASDIPDFKIGYALQRNLVKVSAITEALRTTAFLMEKTKNPDAKQASVPQEALDEESEIEFFTIPMSHVEKLPAEVQNKLTARILFGLCPEIIQ